jgi:hypothetical protein
MIRAFSILLVFSAPVGAETARVYSGEHNDFTRIVVELPSASEWTVGRTDTGYAFAARGGTQPDYDLSAVWQRISRSRIAALQTDPESGALLVSLGCDCHVFPFEYRPGAIVLDVKPGPAPSGSVFEATFAAPDAEPSGQASETQGNAYNWLHARPALSAHSPKALPLPLPTGGVSLDPLRNSLLEQIARGAADGVVDMGRRIPPQDKSHRETEPLPWSTIMLGENPGIQVTDPDAFVAGTVPAGDCTADDLLEVSAWGGDGPPLDLLSAARNGLYGELDIADPDALLRSVRSHLFLGFGAEAAQLSELAKGSDNEDVMALYRSMARALDGDSDPGTPFANMLDCDGPAALWAALARDRLPAGPDLNRDAVLRSFLALPAHLRAHLGPRLADKFLDIDDPDAVRTIRDAMARAPDINTATVALVDAERELHLGNADAAQAHAEEAIALEGNAAEGLIALVEAHVQKLAPIETNVAEALIAGRAEAGKSDDAAKMDRAIILALALSGQIDAAFAQDDASGETREDLWSIVQTLANDDDFLRHAVLPADSSPPDLSDDLRLAISRRLVDLGFPDAALAWLGTVQAGDAPDRRLIAATALQGMDDAEAALALLEGLAGPEAASVRAMALLQLGDLAAAEEALSATGQVEAASRTDLWREDWSALDPTTPEIWQAAAGLTKPAVTEDAPGLLGRGAQTIEASANARAAIDALLKGVERPEDE